MGREAEAIVRGFFDVMNEYDADDLDTLFTGDAEIVMGPHVARGLAEIREIVLQNPPELLITSEPTHVDVSGDRAVVAFRRHQVWRDSREPALERTCGRRSRSRKAGSSAQSSCAPRRVPIRHLREP